MHFHVASVLDLPEGWSNNFDLVHQRFLMGALRVDDWRVGLSELLRVLKPGGTVQLVENIYCRPSESGTSQRFYDLFDAFFNSLGLSQRIAIELPTLLESAGFVEVSWEDKVVLNGNGKEWGEDAARAAAIHFIGMRSLAQSVVAAGFVGSVSEYEQMMSDLEKEWEEKGERVTARIICARKPSKL